MLPPVPPLVAMDVWAIAVMGAYTDAGTKYQAMLTCLADYRAKGVIQ